MPTTSTSARSDDEEVSRPSKHQRYYWRNAPEIRKKNAERMRVKRAEARGSKQNANPSAKIKSKPLYQDIGVQTEEHLEMAGPEASAFLWNEPLREAIPTVEFRPLDALDAEFGDTEYSYYGDFLHLRDGAQKWASHWGGISAWPATFEGLFYRALARGPDRVQQFIQRLSVHELEGRMLLLRAQTFHSALPISDSTYAIPILWAYQQEILITLVQGLTVIQTRVPLMTQSKFAVGPGPALNAAIVESFRNGLGGGRVEQNSNDAEDEASVLDALTTTD